MKEKNDRIILLAIVPEEQIVNFIVYEPGEANALAEIQSPKYCLRILDIGNKIS